MRQMQSLYSVQRWAVTRFGECAATAAGLRRPLSHDDTLTARVLALETANTWASFMRSYYVMTATGGWTTSGSRIAAGVRLGSVDKAITFAVHDLKPSKRGSSGPWSNRDEPDWLDPHTISRLLRALGSSNEAGFHAAISLGSSVHQDLLTYRNFVAHRNRDTARKVRDVGKKYRVPYDPDPLEIPLQLVRKRPYSILQSWISDLEVMASLVPI